jgi:4-alpha-glucanotransferase
MTGADPFGIVDGYHDVGGTWHATAPATRAALRAAMGADPDAGAPPPAEQPVWVVRTGTGFPISLDGRCHLVLEDTTDVGALDELPADLPIGYHELVPLDGGPTTRLIASPGRCALDPALRGWLWTVQLHAARSSRSWGIGDLTDLARLASRAHADGAWGIAVNPVGAALPIERQQPSPYFASSRRWVNPLYLDIDAIPGAATDPAVGALATEARELLAARRIDRDAVWRIKSSALELLWKSTRDRPLPSFETWRHDQGPALLAHARFSALAEHHGSGWQSWPEEHRHPHAAAVARFAADHADRVLFHAWVQWLLARQLAAAGSMGVRVLHDLPVGVDPNGGDAWIMQDLLALGASVGAPPDDFAVDGQDWGLPPFVPWKLRALAYEPLAEMFRAALAGGGLRVDHVMGLFRLFWIPRGSPPRDGAYVRYAGRELLDVLCIESARAGAHVVGEDLGTVEDEVRHALGDAGVLSTRLVWFEPGPPETFPHQSMAAATTHDLPTIAGAWTGSDADELVALGREVDAGAVRALRSRLVELAGDAGAELPAVRDAVHRRLALSPAMLVSATLEDALGVAERPNVPGTTEDRPDNWSLALPVPIDTAFDEPGVRSTVELMRAAGR